MSINKYYKRLDKKDIHSEKDKEINLLKLYENNDHLLFDVDTENVAEELNEIDQSKTHKYLPDNLKFKRFLENSGKQGLVGILRCKSGECIYKISQQANYIINLENTVLQSLNELRDYCPHFCRGFGKLKTRVDTDFRDVSNPFEVNKHYILNDVLLMERITDSKKLYRYIKNQDIEEKVVYSIIKQVMLALSIAQSKKKFTHYDLHSDNILIKKCDPDAVFLYVLENGNSYAVPTYGYYPVIIDYGFSYVKDMENNFMYSPLAHNDAGYTTNSFDPINDPKLFLVTVSEEMKKYRQTETSLMFRNMVKNMFKNLDISWKSGWDNTGLDSCSDTISNYVNKYHKKSSFFEEYGDYCIDLIQSLITLPIKNRPHEDLKDVYKMIIEEFRGIEKEIGSKFHNLYLFKEMINAARTVKEEYCNRKTREQAVYKFKSMVLDYISGVVRFSSPKINWDKILCGLIVCSREMEGKIYSTINRQIKQKNLDYQNLPINNVEQMYECIEYNIPSEYEYTEDTTVYIWDSVNEISKKVTVDNQLIRSLNKYIPLERGKILYEHYNDN